MKDIEIQIQMGRRDGGGVSFGVAGVVCKDRWREVRKEKEELA